MFNIYESSLDYEIMNCIDSIELDFVPYQLTHTTYNSNQDPCFVLSGSDQKIHIFCCSQEQTFAEVEADDIFPELLKELPSVALSIAFKCHDSKRYEVHPATIYILPYVRHYKPWLVHYLPHFSLWFIV